MEPQGTPKGTPNPIKSAKMFTRTPPKTLRKRSSEKVGSRNLPGPQKVLFYYSKTHIFNVPPILKKWQKIVNVGSMLGTFGTKKRKRAAKVTFQKYIKKIMQKQWLQGAKMEPKRAQIQTKSRHLWAPFSFPGPFDPWRCSGTNSAQFFIKILWFSNEIWTSFNKLFMLSCILFTDDFYHTPYLLNKNPVEFKAEITARPRSDFRRELNPALDFVGGGGDDTPHGVFNIYIYIYIYIYL